MIEFALRGCGHYEDKTWNTVVRIPKTIEELPRPKHIETLFLDLETTSGAPDRTSIDPHSEVMDEDSLTLLSGSRTCGIAYLADDERIPYYIPIRHAYLEEDGTYNYGLGDIPNLPINGVSEWLKHTLSISKTWWNHNIKYDAHIILNELGNIKLPKMFCSLCMSKLSQMEERLSYDLTSVMKVFNIYIHPYENSMKPYLGRKNKDYGLIPIPIIAPYAAVDVLCIQFLKKNLVFSPDQNRIIDLEQRLLTPIIKMERVGVKVRPDRMFSDWNKIAKRQTRRISRIKQASSYKGFDPGNKKSLETLFIDNLGWDVGYTEKSLLKYEKGLIEKPTHSYSYESLLPNKKRNPGIFSNWIGYQDDEKLMNSFIKPYLIKYTNSYDIMHFNINQIVHTGRFSCTSPNIQQLPPTAKEYIIPIDEDYVLVEFDLSQIEFRVIVNYIGNVRCIRQYQNDPATDFHDWVAEMCGIDRKAAKNVNFMLGYGGGKKKCVKMLSSHPKIILDLTSHDQIMMRANEVYQAYHNNLPELKPTMNRASHVLSSRGYVRTLLGRRRYLPKLFCYKAFNSVCQGSAADIMKDITLRLQQFVSIDCILHCIVHDSWLFSIRRSLLHHYIAEIKHEIERPLENVDFSVPLLSDYGTSETCWRECD